MKVRLIVLRIMLVLIMIPYLLLGMCFQALGDGALVVFALIIGIVMIALTFDLNPESAQTELNSGKDIRLADTAAVDSVEKQSDAGVKADAKSVPITLDDVLSGGEGKSSEAMTKNDK